MVICAGLRVAIKLLPEAEAPAEQNAPNNELTPLPVVTATEEKLVEETPSTLITPNKTEPALPNFVDLPNEEQSKPIKAQLTELVKERETIEMSRFICGQCQQNHRGDYMKAPLIDPRGFIPTEQTIIEQSLCKFCAPTDGAGWLAGVLRFAETVKQDRVEFVMKMMNNTLNGDSEKPDHIRIRYLKTHSRKERADKALNFYERLINDASKKRFAENEKAKSLLDLAHEWRRQELRKQMSNKTPKLTGAKKRIATIRKRIDAGNFKRAANTISAARREFPDFVEVWDELESLLQATISNKEEQKNIKQLRIDINEAIKDDDADKLINLITFGLTTYPSIDWEKVAEDALAA